MEKKLEDLRKFLKEKYQGMQAFNTRNTVGDSMETVYQKDGIVVDECHNWGYIEIFGLSEDEFKGLLKVEKVFGIPSYYINIK